MNNKICTKCKQTKLLNEFHAVSKVNKKPRAACKECNKLYFRKNYEKNPEKYRGYKQNKPYVYRAELKRKYNLKTFGLTVDQYENMLIKQKGVCAICLECCTSGKRLAVDHCHKTGKVRQLLCRRCNQSMGKFNDDPVLLQKVVNYLLKWQA